MHFKRIELNGFKSFADPVTIEFTDGITCIVGPNGSGKSNISDAILWVLGEQSPKTLRSDKLEEVIFSGTQSRKAKGMAEVTLVIDNTDHSLPIDFTEVGITRRAYRSGENEYHINRRPCRLKDIRELIMDTGIGVEGYSIVGQGKIADIVSNKMERRREIFEEAAGIVKYRTKKEKTEKSLAEASINLSRVNDIVREIESRIGGLEEDSRKAQEYLEIKEKYKGVEINIILKNIEAADEKTAAVKQELAELEAQIASATAGKEELEQQIRAEKDAANALEEKLSALRDELLEKTEQIHEISSREELNKERLASLKKDEERITAEIAAAEEKLNREEENARQTREALEKARSEAKALTEDLAVKHKAAQAASEKLSEAEDRLTAEKNVLFDLSAKIQAAQASAQSVESLKDTLNRRAARLDEEADLKDRSDRQLAEKQKECEASIDRLAEERRVLAQQLADAQKAQAEASAKLADANSETEEIKVSIGKVSARKALLEELERSYEGYSGGVKFLMSQKVSGIIGTLGDLLQVPKGYELAIETVLGGKLQNIVCRDDSTAKRSIELLKKSRAGRLTFLPVEDLKVQPPLSCSEIEGFKGFIGLASDMVGCEGGYTNVVEYVLGNVVLVDNIDDALRISQKNSGPHKLVTLEGEVINAAGAITGGSFKNNTANILTRKAEKEDLEKKAASLKKKLAELDALKEKAQSSILKAADDKHRAEDSIRESDLKKAILERDLQMAKQAVIDAAGAEEKRLAELSELKAELAAAEKQTGELAEQAASLEKLKAEKTEAITVLSEESEKLRDALSKALADETSARLAENAARLTAQNAEGLAELAEGTIREIAEDKAEKERSLEKTRIAAKQITDFAGGAGDILREAEDRRKTIEEEIADLSSKRQAANARAEELDQEKALADKDLYDKQLRKHDADVRAARFDAQTETLKDKLWEEYEMSYAQAATMEDPAFVMSRALKESREYKERLRALGDVNIGAIEEYKQVKQRYDFLTEQRDDAMRAMDELRSVIKEMDDIIRTRFKESFDSIVINFETIFTELFKGGHAALTMSDPDDPLESAIEIEAQPPGKKLQNISLLSGGERTLTAIALMFAVLRSKPTPFCILDEVEAALDETNIDTFAKYVKKFENTQFALVTHQKLTMEYADALYGVTMPEYGISKVLSLRLGDEFEV
ncbi:MAG: chromosome segregation protein SMC [Firmicutes bacterium]|nr:chromosome segregation protein SMC [Bacillota bacterium]